MRSALLGALVIGASATASASSATAAAIQYIVTGLILLAAVTVDTVSRRRLAAPGAETSSRPRDFRMGRLKTSLGIWAFGSMVTRFMPVGYQPQLTNAHDRGEGAPRGQRASGDLIDDYEFHYPAELSPDNLDEVRSALAGHGIYAICAGLHLDPRFGRGGLVNPDPATRAEALRLTLEGADFAGSLGAHFVLWPGIEGYNYPFQTPYAESWGWFIDAVGQAAEVCAQARQEAVPGAQEQRAGDEDPDAQHRHDAARHPHAARPGDHERPGQHGLAAPDHERRVARRVRRACSHAEGLLGHQHANSGWGTFDDDNMVGATAFMETLELALELRRANYGADGERLGFDLYPYTEDAVDVVRRSVLQWDFIDAAAGRIDEPALREAQSRKDAIRAYELVYAALGAVTPGA